MKQPIRIVAIGAGVQDVFLEGKIFKAHKEEDEYVEEFALGSKNDIEGVVFSTGGGGTNAAVTFARQGMHACYLGYVGDDQAGQAVLDDLHKEGVDTSLVKTAKEGTAYSTILLAPNGERTILTYRGASASFELHERDFHDIHADWFYISSLAGNIEALKTILNYAQAHKIQVAINPGKDELKHKSEMLALLKEAHILSLNKQELGMLFEGESLNDLVTEAAKYVTCVIGTDGPHGIVAGYRGKLYKAGVYKDVKVVDRTGAGDAFSSGFVAMAAKDETIKQAITLASANSTSVVGQIGAKAGILHSSAKLQLMSIKIEAL